LPLWGFYKQYTKRLIVSFCLFILYGYLKYVRQSFDSGHILVAGALGGLEEGTILYFHSPFCVDL
jgi:hypothetical protein